MEFGESRYLKISGPFFLQLNPKTSELIKNFILLLRKYDNEK
jgi:hypothetical protein